MIKEEAEFGIFDSKKSYFITFTSFSDSLQSVSHHAIYLWRGSNYQYLLIPHFRRPRAVKPRKSNVQIPGNIIQEAFNFIRS